jgi:hypothetical protein
VAVFLGVTPKVLGEKADAELTKRDATVILRNFMTALRKKTMERDVDDGTIDRNKKESLSMLDSVYSTNVTK